MLSYNIHRAFAPKNTYHHPAVKHKANDEITPLPNNRVIKDIAYPHFFIRFGKANALLAPQQLAASYPDFPTVDQFKAFMTEAGSAYIGSLPPLLKSSKTGLSEQQSLEYVSQLSGFLQSFGFKDMPTLVLRVGKEKIICDYVGQGNYGKVFKLSNSENQNMATALKVYHPDYDDSGERMRLRHGPYGEIASGAFLSQYPIKNWASFYCGTPAKENQAWSLIEWIGKETDIKQRPGKELASVLKRFNLQANDVRYDSDVNTVSGIQIDHGGIGEIPKYQSLSDIHSLDDVKDCIRSDTQSRDLLARGLSSLPDDCQKAAIKELLPYPDSWTQIPWFLTDKKPALMPELKDDLTKTFYSNLRQSSPDQHIESLLKVFQGNEKLDAYQAVLRQPKCWSPFLQPDLVFMESPELLEQGQRIYEDTLETAIATPSSREYICRLFTFNRDPNIHYLERALQFPETEEGCFKQKQIQVVPLSMQRAIYLKHATRPAYLTGILQEVEKGIATVPGLKEDLFNTSINNPATRLTAIGYWFSNPDNFGRTATEIKTQLKLVAKEQFPQITIEDIQTSE